MPPDGVGLYGFRPVVPDDRDKLAAWLAVPHVARWWGEAKDAVPSILAHLADPAMRCRIVSIAGREAGYIQSYDPHAEADHPYRDQPPGTLGIDQFIGEADLVGRGHGPALIDCFVRLAFAEGARRIITDPDPANQRAVRAYAKAGFRLLDRRTTIYGPALIMGRDAEEETRLP
jgi:aminoglycoside 6'-N-acetyltransferase